MPQKLCRPGFAGGFGLLLLRVDLDGGGYKGQERCRMGSRLCMMWRSGAREGGFGFVGCGLNRKLPWMTEGEAPAKTGLPRSVLSQVPKCEAPGAPIFRGCAYFSRQLGHPPKVERSVLMES